MHCCFCGRPDPGRSFSGAGMAPFAERARLPHWERPALRFLWEARPGAKLFGHRAGAIRREGATPTLGTACTAVFCRRPDPGRSFSGTWPAPFAARARLLHWGRCALLYLWEARPGAKLFRAPGWRYSPRGRASHIGSGVHCFICGRPALGAKRLICRTWFHPERSGERMTTTIRTVGGSLFRH